MYNSTSLEQPGDLAQLLEQYPEPVWLANQTVRCLMVRFDLRVQAS